MHNFEKVWFEMVIAIIKENTVVDIAVFDNIEMSQQFLSDGAWSEIGADNVLELPAHFGIGDSFLDGEWIKQEKNESDIDTMAGGESR